MSVHNRSFVSEGNRFSVTPGRRSRRRQRIRLDRAVGSICEALETRQLLSGTIYYLSTTGSDSHTGTNSTTEAWATFNHAVGSMSSGDTLYVEPGTYPQMINLSGLSGVTIEADPADKSTPVITGADALNATWAKVSTSGSDTIYSTPYTAPACTNPNETNQLEYPQEVIVNTQFLTEIGQELNSSGVGAYADEAKSDSDSGAAREPIGTGESTMTNNSFYWNITTNTLYVEIPTSQGTPSSVQVTTRDKWITPGGSDWTFSNLQFMYSNGGAIDDDYSDLGANGYMNASISAPSGSKFSNCTMNNAGYSAIQVGQGTQIEYDTIDSNGSDGITSGSDGSGFAVEHSTLQDNNLRNFDVNWGASAIKVISSGTYGGYEEGNIDNNDISYNNCGAVWSDTNTNSPTAELYIYDNFIHNNSPSSVDYVSAPTQYFSGTGEAAIKIEVSQYVRVYNNVVSDNYNGILVAASAHVEVYDNTIIGNQGLAAFQAGEDDLRQVTGHDEPVAYDDFQNNIIYNNYTTYDELFLQSTSQYSDGTDLASNNTSDHNLFYRFGEPLQLSDGSELAGLANPNGGNYNGLNCLGPTYTDLASWNAATGWDADSVDGSPSFSTANGSQQIPGDNSYADNIGTATLADGKSAPATDYNNNPRSTTNIGVGALAASGSAGPGNSPVALSPDAWVDDTLPTGAVPATFRAPGTANPTTGSTELDPWSWVGANTSTDPFDFVPASAPPSGVLAAIPDELNSNGPHAMLFQSATQTMSIASTDRLEAQVYIDPSDVPSEIMIHYEVGTTWYRAYWGANNITSFSYEDSTTTAYQISSSVPTAGGWTKLTFSTSQLGNISGTVTGLALETYNGQAAWDDIGVYHPIPTAPSQIQATATASTINLTWNDNSNNESGFDIYRSATAGSFSGTPYTSVGLGVTTYIDSSLGSGTTYYYEVEATNGNGNSAPGTATNGGTEVTGRLGLAGAWDFEDATNSTVISDDSGNGNTGTIQGEGAGPAVPLTNGSPLVGDHANFTAQAGSYISIPAAAGSSLAPTSFTMMTIEAWVYVSGSATSANNKSGVDKSGTYGLLERTDVAGASPTAPAWEFYVGGSPDAISTAFTPKDTWCLVVGTWGGEEPGIHIFTTGGTETSNYVDYTTPVSSNSNAINIGRGGTSAYFHGAIDEVEVVMGRELTGAEITADYNAGEAGFHPAVITGSPVATPLATSPFSSTPISDSSDLKKQSLVSQIGLD